MDKPLVLNLTTLTLILSVAIPLVTGLLTKSTAPAWFKSLSTVVLAFVVGVIQTVVQTDGVIEHPRAFASATLTAFIIAIASYYGFYKPTNIAPKVAAVSGDKALGPKGESGI